MKVSTTSRMDRHDGKIAFRKQRVPLSDCSDRLNRREVESVESQKSSLEKNSKKPSRPCFVSKCRDSVSNDTAVSDAIDLTWKKLKELGFSDEDTSWAIEEAKNRRSCLQSSIDSLTSVLDRLTVEEVTTTDPKPEVYDEVSRPSSSADQQQSLTGSVLVLVLKRIDTWTLIENARYVNNEWKAAVLDVLGSQLPLEEDDQRESKLVKTDQFSKHFPWGCFLAEGGKFLEPSSNLSRSFFPSLERACVQASSRCSSRTTLQLHGGRQ